MNYDFVIDDAHFHTVARRSVDNDARMAQLSSTYRFYYRIRHLVPGAVRRFLQRRAICNGKARGNWYIADDVVQAFRDALPREPVSSTVIHPWPHGKSFAFVLTHDVETFEGLQSIESVARIEEDLGFRSSWNLVPYKYPIDTGLVKDLVARGFEIGIHGYNHDGRLFFSREAFRQRLPAINAAIAKYRAVGFRAPMVHRNLSWLQELNVQYDASCFDIDPFQPMPGGVRSIWPFICGKFVELPYTLPQDHTLFVVLRERDCRIWNQKLEYLRANLGMALMLTHPDYMTDKNVLNHYRHFLTSVKERGDYWHAVPRDVARWWNERRQSAVELDESEPEVVAGPAQRTGSVATLQSIGAQLDSKQSATGWSQIGLPASSFPPAKPRRVLMLIENCPYPQDTRVLRESQALISAGYEVSVICPRSDRQRLCECVGGVNVNRYPAPPAGKGLIGYVLEYGYSLMASFVLSLVVLFRRGFDVLHAHSPPDFFVLIAAVYKLLGKQYIFDHHDLSPEMYFARFRGQGNRIVHRVLVFFEKLSCRTADRVIATNESYREMELKRSGIPWQRVTVVRNGPDLRRVRPTEPDAKLAGDGRFILGYVGIMGVQDGIDYLLRSLAHLKRDLGRSDFYAVLIGQGDARKEMQNLSAKLGLNDHVWFTGRVSDENLLRYLSAAHICLDPDPSNPFNDRSTMIKMTEYMALGRPIVAFDLPEHRVTAQSAALYARPNDELDFARQIVTLMDDPKMRHDMGRIGQERVKTHLAWKHQSKHLLAAYDALFSTRQELLPVTEKQSTSTLTKVWSEAQ